MQQWLLARPEMREFLQSRAMVPYKEAWMAAVDTMKTLQGWTGRHRHPLPRPRRLRRADPAVDPLRRLDRRQRRGLGQELGALLAAGDPELHPRLSRRDRRRPDQSRHRRSHHAGRAPAEAAGDATGAVKMRARARLHLGALSRAAPPKPVAALLVGAHDGQARGAGVTAGQCLAIAGRFAALVGCESARAPCLDAASVLGPVRTARK